MAVNIDDIKFEEGSEMPVLHPTTGEPLKDEKGQVATIKLAGVDSDIYRKASNKITNRRVKKGSRSQSMTIERVEADAMELICACTLQWSGLLVGGKVPKTPEELYAGAKWLRQQAEEWIHDRANYLGN